MKIEYMLAFLGGVELMALANALSLGLLPCRLLGLIFMLAALVAAALLGYSACYKHLRKAVDRRSYHEGVCKGIRIGRAERQSEVQRIGRIIPFGGIVPRLNAAPYGTVASPWTARRCQVNAQSRARMPGKHSVDLDTEQGKI